MTAKGAAYQNYNEHDEVKIWQSLIVNDLGKDAMAVPPGTLSEKTTFINSWSVDSKDIAVELHLNAAPGNAVVHGSETLYYPNSLRGKALAQAIQAKLSEVFPPNRGAKEGYYRMDPSNGPDWFLRKTTCTAVIIEPEFIMHMSSIQEKRNHACQTIAQTLRHFIE